MTQPTLTFRKWMTETAAAVLLALPAAFVAVPADAGIIPAGTVYPRAAVSSDAYRMPPQLLSAVVARPMPAQHRGQSPARQAIRDANLRQVDYEQNQQTADGAGGYSVQAELQRLYAEQGREMPQMTMPAHRPAPVTFPATTASTSNSAPPVAAQRPEKPSGLLAGLFDFGRSRNSRRSGSNITRPPVEPAPFQPPTYRQQQAQQQQAQQQRAQQRQAAQTPERRMANSPSPARQPSAQTAQSNSVIELKRIDPERNLAVQGNEFFPEDAGTQPAIVPETAPSIAAESTDDMAEFFPDDVAASPAVASAANTAKQQMQRMFREQEQTTGDGFQMPVESQEAIVPAPAPAAVSDQVITNVTPMPSDGPAEPAPFFADEERAINPEESMEISAIDGQTFDPSGADSQSTAGDVSDAKTAGSRMQQIAARDGVGLKGYCAVALRDERRLADGKAAYVSYYQGRAYYFSSDVAKDKFDADPSAYAPACGGEDVTMKTLTGEVVEGSLDHSVWYKGRLYLFHTAENLKTFMAAPSAMAVKE